MYKRYGNVACIEASLVLLKDNCVVLNMAAFSCCINS